MGGAYNESWLAPNEITYSAGCEGSESIDIGSLVF